ERQHRPGGIERHPAHLIELVIVSIEVASDGVHEEVVDGLVDARAGLDEGVFDRVERPADSDLQARLLLDLADRGLLAALAGLRRALGQRPRPAIALAPAAADDEEWLAGLVPDDDPAC